MVADDGHPYCSKDYNFLFAPRCSTCERPIQSGSNVISLGNQVYHPEHFCCAFCKKSLRHEDSKLPYTVHQNKPFCKPCHTKLYG
jgi:paxillin